MDGLRFVVTPTPSAALPDDGAIRRRVRLVPDEVVRAVDRRFLSVAIDARRVVQHTDEAAVPFDFDRPALVRLARHLGPAYLRIGGADADRTFYALRGRAKEPPAGYEAVLTAARWDEMINFAQDAGFSLVFTLNGGPSARDRAGAWQDGQARLLIEHAAARQDPVLVWELGHELNGVQVSAEQYAQDLDVAMRLVQERSRGSLLAGPACRFWPEIGEPEPRYWATLARAAHALDVITWHYFPRPHGLARGVQGPAVTSPELLDEVEIWARQVDRVRTACGVPDTPVWLSDTALHHATVASDVEPFEGSLWWVDHLACLARRGQAVVIRQALADATHGLIDDTTLQPRPDFWISVMWQRLMGREVLHPTVEGDDRRVRVYAHWTPMGLGLPDHSVTLLVINLEAAPVCVELPQLATQRALAFRIGDDGDGLTINGRPPSVASDGSLAPVAAEAIDLETTATVTVAARSFGFFVLAPTGAAFGA